jgi:hypothetical protein
MPEETEEYHENNQGRSSPYRDSNLMSLEYETIYHDVQIS